MCSQSKEQGWWNVKNLSSPLSKEQYERLRQKVDGYVIEKNRYRIPLEGGLVAELDEFLGRSQGLWLVEAELTSREAMANFTPPQWFGDATFPMTGHFRTAGFPRWKAIVELYCLELSKNL